MLLQVTKRLASWVFKGISCIKNPSRQILYSSDLFFYFICQEIPNVLGILSLVSILSLVLVTNRVAIILIVTTLFYLYLVQKSFSFLKEEITDSYSKTNRHDIKDSYKLTTWSLFLLVAYVLFTLLTIWIVVSVSPGGKLSLHMVDQDGAHEEMNR